MTDSPAKDAAPPSSVLSAVEGLQVAAPSLGAFVLPLTIAILIGLEVGL
jgi:KUP system potassium uptake protein